MFAAVVWTALLTSCGGPSTRDITEAIMTSFPGTGQISGLHVQSQSRNEAGDYIVTASYDVTGRRPMQTDPPGHYTFRLTMTHLDARWKILHLELISAEPLHS